MVLIFPENTLTKVGLVVCSLIIVGRESSSSDSIRIGLISNFEFRYFRSNIGSMYLLPRLYISDQADCSLWAQTMQYLIPCMSQTSCPAAFLKTGTTS